MLINIYRKLNKLYKFIIKIVNSVIIYKIFITNARFSLLHTIYDDYYLYCLCHRHCHLHHHCHYQLHKPSAAITLSFTSDTVVGITIDTAITADVAIVVSMSTIVVAVVFEQKLEIKSNK